MAQAESRGTLCVVALLTAVCFLATSVRAQYGGGTGEADDPYLIYTPEHLDTIGTRSADWDKHFKLMADIDLSGFDGQAGRPAFRIVAPDTDPAGAGFQGTPFTGVFDGNDHAISRLTLAGAGCLGLFGGLGPEARVTHLGMTNVNITAVTGPAGALAGENCGCVLHCYSSGRINTGSGDVEAQSLGGLVGTNAHEATVSLCHSSCTLGGQGGNGKGENFGGLVGWNQSRVLCSYSTGAVSGYDSDSNSFGGLVGRNEGSVIVCRGDGTVTSSTYVGGLVGYNSGRVLNCHSRGSATGNESVGGLIGYNLSTVLNCYSTAKPVGTSRVGGLIGYSTSSAAGMVSGCFWDVERSGLDVSAGGEGKTSAQVVDITTFSAAGWDFLGIREDGLHEIWRMGEGGPALTILGQYMPTQLSGKGTLGQPYVVNDASKLGAVLYYDPTAHYLLAPDIDLSGIRWSMSVIPEFAGVFVGAESYAGGPYTVGYEGGRSYAGGYDGDGFSIRNLTISGSDQVGLFGRIGPGGRVSHIAIEDANVAGVDYVGILAGTNDGVVRACRATGTVGGGDFVGGLVGANHGTVKICDVGGAVVGNDYVGGLAGDNSGTILIGHNTGAVDGDSYVGGITGRNESGEIISCCNTGPISGSGDVGGLVGRSEKGSIRTCHSVGRVSGTGTSIGGLIGSGDAGIVMASFWDTQASGRPTSSGGIGRTTEQMQDRQMFLQAHWDFVGEGGNGLHDIWQMPSAGGYPVLGVFNGNEPPRLTVVYTPGYPYLVSNANELGAILYYDWEANYRLEGDIDLHQVIWSTIVVIPEFSGAFEGNGHTISGLTIDILDADDYVGLFGRLEAGSRVENLAVLDAYVASTASTVGILAGANQGRVVNCHTTGVTSGVNHVGGLVGNNNGGSLSNCYSVADVTGTDCIGGLVGLSTGSVSDSNSTSDVNGTNNVGGLVGRNPGGEIIACFATGKVEGVQYVGGLVGDNTGRATQCYTDMEVTGSSYVGGLVGDNANGSLVNCYSRGSAYGNAVVGGIVGNNYNNGSIIKCYSTCKARGNSQVGGIAGDNTYYECVQIDLIWCKPTYYHAVISGCFWDTQASGLGTSDGGGTGKSTTQMKDSNTYLDAGWNFGSVWEIARNSYPRLRWEAAKAPRIPINDADDLIGLTLTPNDWGKHFVLNADIDLSGISLEPIGHFTGIFDGQGHAISNLTLQLPDLDYVGLFGRLGGGGTVLNLTLTDVDVEGRSYVGAITGFSIGTIDNCRVEGVVSGTRDNIGAVVGKSDQSVIACSSAGTVVGRDYVGGITGFNTANMNDCNNVAEIVGRDYVGGVAGMNNGQLNVSRSTGSVGGRNYVGGLVGRSADAGRVYYCYSTGPVEGDRKVGGLVGRDTGLTKHGYAAGAVVGDNEVGGLIGSSSVAVLDSFWDMATSGQSVSAGGAEARGRATAQMQAEATFLEAGWDLAGEIDNGTDDLWWILDGQDYPRLWWEPQPQEVAAEP